MMSMIVPRMQVIASEHKRARASVGSVALVGVLGLWAAAPATAQTPAAAKPSSAQPAPKSSSGSAAAPKPARPLYATSQSLSRRAALARARTLATARESIDTVVPRYKVDASGELVPDLRAAAGIIYDPETGQVLWEENSQTSRSIASITKVMTATVFLENSPDLSQPVTIARSDVFAASTTFLRTNDRVTGDDLLHLLLIASDNAAARALARVSPWGSAGFIDRMNEKAVELGLDSTRYADPSGLLSDNVSSAFDMARLIAHASSDERISSIMRLPEYTVHTPRREITFRSTDHLLGRDDIDVRAAKTGFISKAGYCLATLLRLPQSEQQVAVVVLGARSNAARFLETQNLLTWLSAKAATLFAARAASATQ
jgi:D-alanyl-D-alanine endopeptidase (penicillin-binding protein 7)